MKPRVLDDDGLDRIVETDIETFVKGAGFENMIRDAETFWRRIPADAPGAPPSFRPSSYARDIQWYLKILRAALQKHPDSEAAVITALRLGHKLTDARWRFTRGRLTRSGKRLVVRQRVAGRASAQKRRARGDAIEREHDQIRDVYPYDRQRHSTRWLASTIAKRLKLKTDAGVLTALRARKLR